MMLALMFQKGLEEISFGVPGNNLDAYALMDIFRDARESIPDYSVDMPIHRYLFREIYNNLCMAAYQFDDVSGAGLCMGLDALAKVVGVAWDPEFIPQKDVPSLYVISPSITGIDFQGLLEVCEE